MTMDPLHQVSSHVLSQSVLRKPSDKMYTASYAFFEALWDAGITCCFVNLGIQNHTSYSVVFRVNTSPGSDHPSLIEAFTKGQVERPGRFPKIYTCPNEVEPCLTMDAASDTN